MVTFTLKALKEMSAFFFLYCGWREKRDDLANPNHFSQSVRSANVSAEENIHKLCPTHQLLIGLDCRWSCRQWAPGKQKKKPMPSQIINHNKPTLKCFFSLENASPTKLGRKTSQRIRWTIMCNGKQSRTETEWQEKLQYISASVGE